MKCRPRRKKCIRDFKPYHQCCNYRILRKRPVEIQTHHWLFACRQYADGGTWIMSCMSYMTNWRWTQLTSESQARARGHLTQLLLPLHCTCKKEQLIRLLYRTEHLFKPHHTTMTHSKTVSLWVFYGPQLRTRARAIIPSIRIRHWELYSDHKSRERR